uniref:Ribonuclease H protein At1g65750 family n=1 Tax=Cajanus cajan TaxID=3821 RepID=A0A151QMJ9_CAJCA|nr:Putative ribonuclease H protein At1g65750 family [Cajanus cajan]
MLSWKTKTLSFARRMTIIKAIISAMPSYVMQSGKVPRYICDELEKISTGFLWVDQEGTRKLHTVAWDSICKPKDSGGPGIRSMRKVNDAFLKKLAWELCSCRDKLWVNIIRGK